MSKLGVGTVPFLFFLFLYSLVFKKKIQKHVKNPKNLKKKTINGGSVFSNAFFHCDQNPDQD